MFGLQMVCTLNCCFLSALRQDGTAHLSSMCHSVIHDKSEMSIVSKQLNIFGTYFQILFFMPTSLHGVLMVTQS